MLRPIHPFAARMAPSIVWERLATAGDKPLIVLDPMAGSGTTVVASRLRGHVALGFDSDPLAVLIAAAWSSDLAPDFTDDAQAVLEVARVLIRDIRRSMAYPPGADEETRAFTRYWFDVRSRRQLTALAEAIELAEVDDHTRSALWCAFSRLIIVKVSGVSLAMDVAHSRPHRVYDAAPVAPFDGFLSAARVVARNSPFRQGVPNPQAFVSRADARSLPLPSDAVDVVITSPPYGSAIDYLRGHKFTLVWMRHGLKDLRELRSTNVGSEAGSGTRLDDNAEAVLRQIADLDRLPTRHAGVLRRYILDMHAVISEIGRVLVPGGKAVFVVGDGNRRGVFVRHSRAIELICTTFGLDVQGKESRPLPSMHRYLPPPGNEASGPQLQTRMHQEVILTVVKPGGRS